MPTIVLTQMEISPFCDKVRRVLHFKGLEFTTHDVGLASLPFLKKHAPTGKVPVLEYAGQKFYDSTDICLMLEKEHPAPPLVPEDAALKADVLLLEDWADETLYFFEMTMRFAWPDDSARWSREIAKLDHPIVRGLAPILVPKLIRQITGNQGLGRKDRAHVLRDLNRLLEALTPRIAAGGFCVGKQLSLADISIAAQIHCIQGSGEGASVVESHPVIADWKRRVDSMSRP